MKLSSKLVYAFNFDVGRTTAVVALTPIALLLFARILRLILRGGMWDAWLGHSPPTFLVHSVMRTCFRVFRHGEHTCEAGLRIRLLLEELRKSLEI